MIQISYGAAFYSSSLRIRPVSSRDDNRSVKIGSSMLDLEGSGNLVGFSNSLTGRRFNVNAVTHAGSGSDTGRFETPLKPLLNVSR